jgi:hypothetical protein
VTPFDLEKIVQPEAHCVFTKPAEVPFGTSPTSVASINKISPLQMKENIVVDQHIARQHTQESQKQMGYS